MSLSLDVIGRPSTSVDGLWPFFVRDKLGRNIRSDQTDDRCGDALPIPGTLSIERFDALDEPTDGRGISHDVDTVVGFL